MLPYLSGKVVDVNEHGNEVAGERASAASLSPAETIKKENKIEKSW